MNFLKGLFSWQLLLSIILAAALLVGLYFGTFKWLNSFTSHGVTVEIPNLNDLKVAEATAKLDDLNLRYEIDSVKYTDEYEPHAIIEYFPGTGTKVKPGRRVFIKSNPKTWAPVAVPDLIDKSMRLALTQLSMKGFSVNDTIYEDDPAKNAILRLELNGKTITPGTMLPRGTAIDLVIGRGYEMDVPVPDVTGLTLNEATDRLERNFFLKGQVYYFGNQQEGQSPKVVYQVPEQNTEYDEGLPVTLYLSTKGRGQLWKQIDSLDTVYRRNVSSSDSIYYDSQTTVNLQDLDADIINQVQNDFNSVEDSRNNQIERQREENNKRLQIDTTGIVIE